MNGGLTSSCIEDCNLLVGYRCLLSLFNRMVLCRGLFVVWFAIVLKLLTSSCGMRLLLIVWGIVVNVRIRFVI